MQNVKTDGQDGFNGRSCKTNNYGTVILTASEETENNFCLSAKRETRTGSSRRERNNGDAYRKDCREA